MPKLPIQDPRKASAALAALPTAEAGRASPSAAASSAIVTLYVVLEDAYERERKAYKPGWDDARVAAETGLPPAVVTERRERDFGPLKSAPTREEIRAAMAELTGAWMAMSQALSQVASTRDRMTEALAKVVAVLESAP